MTPLLMTLMIVAAAVANDPLVVETTAGKVKGTKMTSRNGREFLAFPGIPYAKAPVGPLRFQPPVEAEQWTGVKDVSKPGPWCIQYNIFALDPQVVGSEDCLYLAVYTHGTKSQNAVLVHIHGGGFICGSAVHTTHPTFMMDEDIVIVDINFRLGFFGYLCFEDREMPGNQAFKDQVLALKWVQKNIAKFGGDPNSVTIVGESAGGGSVSHHTVSPLSKGLFHRAIAESGTSYNLWALSSPGLWKYNAKRLAENLGCPGDSTSAAVSCLRSKTGSEIAFALEAFREWTIDTKIGWPCLEPEGPGAFLTGPVSKWKHEPVPFMMGSTSGEGLFKTRYFPYYNVSYEWLNENFDRVAPMTFMYNLTSTNAEEITQKLRNYYFEGGLIQEESSFNLTQLYSDCWFVIGIIDTANRHTGDVYYYYFDYIGENTYYPENNRTYYFGAPHTEEFNFIWQNPTVNWTHKGEDLKFSKRMVKIWTDFAKFGNPAPRGSDITWTKWNPQRHNYLEMSHSGFIEKEGLAMERYKFWQTLNYRDKLE